jgi:hypothetical protein
MNQPSPYLQYLVPHSDLLVEIAKSCKAKRIQWSKIINSRPDLKAKFFTGERSELDQIKHISHFYSHYLAKKERKANAPPMAARFDANRDLLVDMARRYSNNGTTHVQWLRAFRENPELAKTLGFEPEEITAALVSNLGFWYRSRVTHTRKTAGRQNGMVEAPVAPATATAQAPAPPPERQWNYCPNCGFGLGAHGLAAGIVAAFARAGLSNEQILETLARTALTVSKLGKG